jgi:thiamine pyrophosphokinase
MPPGLLRIWATSAKHIIAADAGADRLLEAGVQPTVIVGDLDSISERAQNLGIEVVHLADQDSTDCDKLLALAASRGIKEITLASVEGDSLDHLIGTVYSAARASINVRFALRTGLGWIVRTGTHEMSTTMGRRVSLLPISPCKGVHLKGVHWPLVNASLAPLSLVSVSNRATGDRVGVTIEEGVGLFIVEYAVEEMPLW